MEIKCCGKQGRTSEGRGQLGSVWGGPVLGEASGHLCLSADFSEVPVRAIRGPH